MRLLYCPSTIESDFLQKEYLQAKYHVPKEVNEIASFVASLLRETYGSFIGLCLVGGLVNGSYVIRSRKLNNEAGASGFIKKLLWGKRVASDVDFYLIVDGASSFELNGMADIAAHYFQKAGFTIDGCLNGRDPDKALDFKKIDKLIRREEYNLLSLPFKCVYGLQMVARELVAAKVMELENCAKIWEQIKFYHDTPLAIYHGTFSSEFTDYVYQNWYPQKVQLYGLKR